MLTRSVRAGRSRAKALATRQLRRKQRELDATLAGLRSNAEVALNVGCGDKVIPGSVNCDLFSERADVRADALTLKDHFADGSVDFIESHHMLEHLCIEDARAAVAIWSQLLRPGGHLAITCPDLDLLTKKWRRTPSEARDGVIFMFYGSQEHPGMFHKSGYTRERLKSLLDENGVEPTLDYAPYPIRATPSMLVIGRKRSR